MNETLSVLIPREQILAQSAALQTAVMQEHNKLIRAGFMLDLVTGEYHQVYGRVRRPVRIQQIKLHHVDAPARAKGFRSNRTYWVVDQERTNVRGANPARGPLHFVVDREGRREGFFADQFRVVKRGTRRRPEQVLAAVRSAMRYPRWPYGPSDPAPFNLAVYAKD